MKTTRPHAALRTRAGAAIILMAGLVAMTLAPEPAAAQARFHAALDPRTFPVPDVLVPNVQFWRAIFSTYRSTQTVIHDNRDLDVIFDVVDVADLVARDASPATIERAMTDRVKAASDRYARVLRRLGGSTKEAVDPEDVARVRGLYARSARQATDFRAAADRVRGQRGLADRFVEAIQLSGRYMSGIERALTARGVPAEIRCLPFVESMFNDRARSKVGASGVWQFTRDTGRLYLQIDSAVDARNDVWLAADGAARLLADNFRRVGSWPLALTGYNHGIAGMERAQRQLGTSDIGVIAARYASPSFGFASRNFYAEFVAAVTVFADREALFPGLKPHPAVTFDEFAPERFVSLLDLASLTRTPIDALVALNPALDEAVGAGRLLVPAAYPLRIPSGELARFREAYNQLPAERTLTRQASATHRVVRGDTLGALAVRYGTTPAELRRINGLRSSTIRTGQVLQVGVGAALKPLVWTPPTVVTRASTADADRVHVVRAGETLYQIARRYGLSIATLVAANDLNSPDHLLVGMQIAIPVTSR